MTDTLTPENDAPKRDAEVREALIDQMRGITETRVLATSPDVPAFELREMPNGTGGTKLQFEGYASVVERGYDIWSPALGDYTEIIARDAFAKTLSENPDVSLKINHDALPLARTTAGDLQLSADNTGLLARAELNRERADVLLVRQAVEAGHLGAMSFAFRVTRQEWQGNDQEIRRITELNLNHGDVSIVEHPANGATTGMMSLRSKLSEGGITVSAMGALFRELRAGATLSAVNEATLKHILSLVASADTAVDEAQQLISDLLGVTNPDEAQDAAMWADQEPDSDDEGMRSGSPKLALAQLRSASSYLRK